MSHELLIALVSTLIGALIGMIGAGAGILASLIPLELNGKRDHYERLAKIWGLLDFDTKRIDDLCQNHWKETLEALQHVETDNVIPLHTFVRIPSTAWQVAVTNGDFMAQVPQGILNKLTEGYLAVDTLNESVDHYARFTSTSRALSNFSETVVTFYKVINQNCSAITTHFQALKQQIADEEKVNANKAKSRQKRIEVYKWIGTVLFGIVIIVLIVLVIATWKNLTP